MAGSPPDLPDPLPSSPLNLCVIAERKFGNPHAVEAIRVVSEVYVDFLLRSIRRAISGLPALDPPGAIAVPTLGTISTPGVSATPSLPRPERNRRRKEARQAELQRVKIWKHDGGRMISPRLGPCYGMGTALVRLVHDRVMRGPGGLLSHVDPDTLPTYHTLRGFPRELWTERHSVEEEKELNDRAFDA